MKKVRILFTALFACLFAISGVNAASVDANTFEEISTNVTTATGNNIGYWISDKFVCFGCEADPDDEGVQTTSSGLGIYYKDGDSWKTGSFVKKGIAAPFPDNPLSSFFVAMSTNNATYESAIENGFAKYEDGILKASNSGATVTVSAEALENKNLIKLTYNVKNGSTAQSVAVATFNDIYLGAPSDSTTSEACKDNASYEVNTHISNITKGFNAKTSGRFMSVVLEENSGLINNGGGTFLYWVGNYTTPDRTLPSSVVVNMFAGSSELNSSAYSDSAFSYSWIKEMAANEETTFSTLIGLGNLENVAVTIDEDTMRPNYDKDKNLFTLDEDSTGVTLGGTITDKCGMGTYTYTINGENPTEESANGITYYTNGDNFTHNYSVDIANEKLKATGNEFKITVNSVACGTVDATHTFDVNAEKVESGSKTGVNNNYIILGIILLGGMGVYVYSRKHNKFPQV